MKELEIWKPVYGFEDVYEVSNTGRVRSLNRIKMNFGTTPLCIIGKILKQQHVTSGYLKVALCKDGKEKTQLVHILVAKHFIPNLLNKKEVNHIDFDKENNRASNLEWATSKENKEHSVRHGVNARGIRHSQAKLTEEQVLEIRRKKEPWVYTIGMICKDYGISKDTVKRIMNRKLWKHI